MIKWHVFMAQGTNPHILYFTYISSDTNVDIQSDV